METYVNKINGSVLSDDLKHYIDPNDFNRVIYRQRSTDADERMKQLLTDAYISIIVLFMKQEAWKNASKVRFMSVAVK